MSDAIWNDVCGKCKIGRYARMHYVHSASDGFPRPDCHNCPPGEHMHMTCDKCEYWEVSTVPPPTDTTKPESAAAPASAPAPSAAVQSTTTAHAETGRSKSPRGG
jgi:hypothetical protein